MTGTASTDQRIARVVQIVMGRHASAREVALGSEFLGPHPDRSTDGQLSTWQQYCQVLLGSNEFLFRP